MRLSKEAEQFADIIAQEFNKNPIMWKFLDDYEDKQNWRLRNDLHN
jgi:hypothetical protein